jgi:hypothetical protein
MRLVIDTLLNSLPAVTNVSPYWGPRGRHVGLVSPPKGGTIARPMGCRFPLRGAPSPRPTWACEALPPRLLRRARARRTHRALLPPQLHQPPLQALGLGTRRPQRRLSGFKVGRGGARLREGVWDEDEARREAQGVWEGPLKGPRPTWACEALGILLAP